MPRQFRVRKYNPIFEYMPGDLYEDISKDYLDTFDRYEWLGDPFLEDLAQPIAGILNLSLGVMLFPIAIGMSFYKKSFDPILSLICRIVRGATQLITTPLLPFKIITRLVLMKYQEKVSVETMLSTRYREGMKLTVTPIRETLTLLEIEYDKVSEALPKTTESESKDIVVSAKSPSSDLCVLIQLQNRYTRYGEKCYVHTDEVKGGTYVRIVVPSIPAPMSDNEIGRYIGGLLNRYRYLMYAGHPSSLDDPNDFIREVDSVSGTFCKYSKENKPLTVSRYSIHHAQAVLDHFYPRISLKELLEMTGLPRVASGIIAQYSPELFKSNFKVTDMEYKNKTIHKFAPCRPTYTISM